MKRKKKNIKIVYFPLTKKYIAKFNGYWLQEGVLTGIIIKTDSLICASRCDTEDEARRIIKHYIEQEFQETVKIIDY